MKYKKGYLIDYISGNEVKDTPVESQRVEDIGLYKRCDLKPVTNLKTIFKTIRNYLVGNVVGATRNEVLAQQLINIIFCKIYDEKYTKSSKIVSFRAGKNEYPSIVKERIVDLFDKVKTRYPDVFDPNDKIILDERSIYYVVSELQQYCLIDATRDAIGDAFEVFIDHALKEEQGQFFTPKNVVNMIVEMLEPNDEDLIIDPSCGSGGFLIEALRYVWSNITKQGKLYGWTKSEMEMKRQEVAKNCFRGIDNDYFLSKICKAYMAIMGDGDGIFCENSLELPNNWQKKTRDKIELGTFSLIVTNPPFGAKIKVEGKELLEQFDLAHKWKLNKKTKI